MVHNQTIKKNKLMKMPCVYMYDNYYIAEHIYN